MARPTLPRYDLYGDLGVEPWAEADEIDAAYRERMDLLAESSTAADMRRAARLRVAREWLTDPELRARYDASRSRAAARAEKAAAEEAEALAATAPEPDASPTIPWPARDLDRQPPEIAWSSSRLVADDVAARTRPLLLPIGIVGLAGLAGVVLIATLLLITGNLGTNVAGDPSDTPGQSATAAQPTLVESQTPSVAPTAEASAAPPPSVGPSDVPAYVAAMQQSAWQTIESLRAAAETGDVEAAQAFLGDTAPGLRRSGLRRATFPAVDASAITIESSDNLYVAIAGEDRLTSPDGVAWTFDYRDRPLAAYRSPTPDAVRDLWWQEADGMHHLFVAVPGATISTKGVAVEVRWTFDPARPDDATYFSRAAVVITSATLDGVPTDVEARAFRMEGLDSLTARARLPAAEGIPATLALGVTFTNPRVGTSDPRGIETVFTLGVR